MECFSESDLDYKIIDTEDYEVHSPEYCLRKNVDILFFEHHLCQDYKFVFS